ncbi:SAM-dependent methyltransferase [Sphingomonas kaistensis]|uniref:SAM-dependent methyltransferase n=1 Tax=Sphingomonas kaistensis TaxID=298708 RepID=A0A7X5Y5S1_9SPHN|nr:class I SAM-dependent methyltransferase [Sphingomonas kaistensis]NJC05713.1 SAM-dependent methyltransferase [Sphingomonas kaistensis]
MSSWSHGYNVSAGYTYGFYREMAPDWIDFALALRGLVAPRRSAGAPFRYLELGSGQGFGLCLLAAANPDGDFLGIDFSPEHVAHGASLADELGLTNIRFVEGDFAALGAHWPVEHGAFDYIALHGIYSWVPEAIRRSLIAILAAAGAPGAAVYVSFNAMPGWASSLPFQHMLRLIEREGVARGIGAVETGRALFDQLSAVESGVTKALPELRTRIENTRNQPEAYLVQEYLHENWHPLWCSQVMGELGGAKLSLSGSATLAENFLPQLLPANMQGVLAGHDRPTLREDLTDCLINQTFRRDLYVRGPRRRHPGESAWQEEFRLWRIKWSDLPETIGVTTAFGSASLKATEIAAIFDAIGEGSCSLAELAALPGVGADRHLLTQKLVLLVHGGWLGCSRGEPGGAGMGAVNARVASLAAVGAPYRNLAAANLGSAIAVVDSEILLFDAYCQNPRRFEQEAGAMLSERLARLGRRLAKDGQPLTGDAEAAQVEQQAATFTSRTLPAWRRLGITD